MHFFFLAVLFLLHSMNSILSNRIIDHHTPSNSFVRKKTLFYHDHWDHSNRIDQFIDNNNGISNSTMNHPQQINRLRFSSNGAHLYAAGEGGFVRQYRRYPNLNVHCLGEVYRHRGDILDMDISPYDECKFSNFINRQIQSIYFSLHKNSFGNRIER